MCRINGRHMTCITHDILYIWNNSKTSKYTVCTTCTHTVRCYFNEIHSFNYFQNMRAWCCGTCMCMNVFRATYIIFVLQHTLCGTPNVTFGCCSIYMTSKFDDQSLSPKFDAIGSFSFTHSFLVFFICFCCFFVFVPSTIHVE